MNPLVISALVAALASGFGVFKVEEWRFAAKEKERAEQILADERLQAKAVFSKGEHIIAAQNEGVARMVNLSRAAASAGDAAERLRLTSERKLAESASTLAACTTNAASLKAVLGLAIREAQDLGRNADVWANYAQTTNAAIAP